MTRTSRGIGSLRAAATAAAATLAMASLATLAAIVPATPASASALTTTVVPYAGSALTIPDGNTTGVSARSPFGNIGTIRGVDFQIGGGWGGNRLSDGRSVNPGISHPWRSDSCHPPLPAGTTITLFSHTGADGDDYRGTWFSDAAGSSITTTVGREPPLYMPYQPVNAPVRLHRAGPAGHLTFTVADTVLNHTGKAQTLNSFKLRATTGSATNAAPVATADTIVARNTINNVVFQNPGTLANDSDPDGDTILMMPTSRGGGTEFMWDSNGNIPSWTGGTTAGSICGQSFRYKAYDGVTASSAATVNVACVNGPTANADTYSTPMDQPLARPPPACSPTTWPAGATR
ncbi:MAG: Ig-like domain-containing protein [Acidimicrobiales bacterium]